MATTAYPVCMVPRIGSGPAVFYFAGTDVHTDVDATDYFTNGSDAGLKVSDLMFVVKTTATVGATLHSVSAVTAGGAATISPAILA